MEMYNYIKDNNYDGVRELIENGFDPKTRYFGMTLLMLASIYGNPEMLKFLIKRCNVNEIVDSANCEENAGGMTALMFAAGAANYENVLFLLEHNADITMKSDSGLYAFNYWLNNCFENTISDIKYITKRLYFRDIELSPNIINDMVWIHNGRRIVEIIKLLCSFGVNPNVNTYKTPLHMVCESYIGDPFIKECIDILVEFKADPFLKGAYISAYEYAISVESRKWMAEYMLEKTK